MGAEKQIAFFCAQLARAGVDRPYIDSLVAGSSLPKTPRLASGMRDLFFVIPFAPQWGKSSIQKCIAALNAVWSVRISHRLRLSWRLGGTHLVSLVKSFNRSHGYDPLSSSAIQEVGRGRTVA